MTDNPIHDAFEDPNSSLHKTWEGAVNHSEIPNSSTTTENPGTKGVEEIVKRLWLGRVVDLEFSKQVKTALTSYGTARYEEGVNAEATRRDGIEHAIEQSIIDQHVTMAVKAERERTVATLDRAIAEARKDTAHPYAEGCYEGLCHARHIITGKLTV